MIPPGCFGRQVGGSHIYLVEDLSKLHIINQRLYCLAVLIFHTIPDFDIWVRNYEPEMLHDIKTMY